MMRGNNWITTMGLSVLLASAGGAQGAEQHIAAGDSAQAAFNPMVALEHYEAALGVAPTSVAALQKASRSAADVGENTSNEGKRDELYRKANQYAKKAVELAPNDAESHFHLARALGLRALSVGVRDRVKYATEIRAQALEALRHDPNHPGALHVLGVWNAEVMRLSGVERFFAKNLLGGKVFSQASWKDAVSYMEKAVAVDPDRLTHHLDLAKIYADLGEKAKAREQFAYVIDGRQTDSNDPKYKREAAEGLKRLK